MECAAEGCTFSMRYSTTGLCLVCQDLYASGAPVPMGDGYNVPGNVNYNSDYPLDFAVRSSQDPLGVLASGGSWYLSYKGNYGLAKDANGTFYLTTDQSLATHAILFDAYKIPYYVDGGQKYYFKLLGDLGSGTPILAYARDTFSGVDGAMLSGLWTTSDHGLGGTVTIEDGKAVLAPAASTYAFGATAYLSGVKAVSDMEFTCDYSLTSLEEQYPTIGLRTTSNDVWPGGGGASLPKTGYFFVLSPSSSLIQLQQGYQAGTVMDSVAFTFPSKDLKVRAGTSGKNIRIKLWDATLDEPEAWTYDKPLAFLESSGSVIFTSANGSAANSMSVTIDNFVMSTKSYDISNTSEAPVGNVTNFRQKYVENFDTPAAANGPFATTYANTWTPYAEGTGGVYYSGSQISAHDSVMDVYMDGHHGAAGSFGHPTDYYSHVGGKFTMRAKALGARGNGTAVMLWPSSEIWANGEIDYPESNFESTPNVHQHNMVAGDEQTSQDYDTGVSWRDWHTYSIEWIPGTSVKYYLDDALVFTTTTNVPTVAHRYMFQVGNYGDEGHLYIDWVTTYDYDTSVA